MIKVSETRSAIRRIVLTKVAFSALQSVEPW